MLTLNQIKRTFEVIAEAHKQLNGFGFDNIANFGQSNDLQFPCLYVVQKDATISNQTYSRPFDLFILDRYYGDADSANSNITEVLSDTQLIATDIVSLLNNHEYTFQLNKESISIQPVYAQEGDLLAGCILSITLEEAFDYWRCSVPYDFIVIEQNNGLAETSTNEKDPTVPEYVKSITEAQIAGWNMAYPNTNPSGFVTSGQAGNYYPNTNPSGFITSGYVEGKFYPSGNPSGFLTSSYSGFYSSGNPSGFITSANTSGFITSGYTEGRFYPSGNPSGFLVTNNVSGFITSGYTGFYPSGNPSGFITSAYSGYYPSGNPSGFITSGYTNGRFYPSGNPSGFLTTETDPTVPTVVKNMPQSGSAAPVLFDGSGYVLGTRSSTWAARPSGLFRGQIIEITDIGGGTLFEWNGTRWKPVGGTINLLSSGVAVTIGSTTSKTKAASVLVPAGLMNNNSAIKADVTWSMTNNANSKLMEIAANTSDAVGGTAWQQTTISSVGYVREDRILHSRGSLTTQVNGLFATSVGFGNAGGTPPVYNINFGVDQYICINMQKVTSSSDTLILERFTISLSYYD